MTEPRRRIRPENPVELTIDGKPVTVPQGTTILRRAARRRSTPRRSAFSRT
jgi:hypothetical protein